MDVERFLRLDGYTDPHNTISNAVNNQKYNIINFLPLVLFNQFKLFFNFFQLAINLSQFVPLLKVGIYFFIIRVSIHLFVSTYHGHDVDSW
jgi:phospholipid-translocating ATPase